MRIKNYIFCALDFSHLNETIEFTSLIKNYVGGVKLGLEFFINNKGKYSVDYFHKKLGKIMWDKCGMARNKEKLVEDI